MVFNWKVTSILPIMLTLALWWKILSKKYYFDDLTLTQTANHSINIRDTKSLLHYVQTLSLPDGSKNFDFQNFSNWITILDLDYTQATETCKSDKLKIFFVPHSVYIPEWKNQSKSSLKSHKILNNIIESLSKYPELRFIWSDISSLSTFWQDASSATKKKLGQSLANGQLEIVTGGWVESDDANTHYLGILQQLICGHQWLFNSLNYKPKNSWMVGSFGHSPTTAYFLKKMNFQNLVINKINFKIKKYLLQNKNLEFYWRQMWETSKSSDLFTLVLPFHYNTSYCVFSPGTECVSNLSINPNIIESGEGVDAKLDEFRSFARFFHSNMLLVPLGTDSSFVDRYDTMEVIERFSAFIDIIRRHFNDSVEVRYATLSDYFEARFQYCSPRTFKSITGNFFTYSDSSYDYWSAIYSSRPFYKRKDRILLHYMRAAEILYALAWNMERNAGLGDWFVSKQSNMYNYLSEARRSVSLFQHYRAISGTSQAREVLDYAESLNKALNVLQHIMQQSVYFILYIYKYIFQWNNMKKYFAVDEKYVDINSLPKNIIINLYRLSETKKLVIFNSLTRKRSEMVHVTVNSPRVRVYTKNGKDILSQASPFFQGFDLLKRHVYIISFMVEVRALSLVTFFIQLMEPRYVYRSSIRSKITFLSSNNTRSNNTYLEDFDVEFSNLHGFVLSNFHMKVNFSQHGLLQSISFQDDNSTIPVKIYFVVYETLGGGAHVFRPRDAARVFLANVTRVRVLRGPLFSQVDVDFISIRHTVRLFNIKSVSSLGLEIQNFVNWQVDNSEIAMRISTGIKSGDEFFTDLNGFQMVRRRRIGSLGIAGNYYPMSAAAYIEDNEYRLTLLSGQPGGFTSLREGQMEVMLDRRTVSHDKKGLDEGIMDNVPYLNLLTLILERRDSNCEDTETYKHLGTLSPDATLLSYSILYPFIKFFSRTGQDKKLLSNFSAATQDLGNDFHLVNTYSLWRKKGMNVGIILHRTAINKCIRSEKNYFVSTNGAVIFYSIFGSNIKGNFRESSLSFLRLGKIVRKERIFYFDTMTIKAYLIS